MAASRCAASYARRPSSARRARAAAALTLTALRDTRPLREPSASDSSWSAASLMAFRWRSCSICLPGGARSGCQTFACLRRASWTSRFSNGGSSSRRSSACSMSRTCGTTFEGIGPLHSVPTVLLLSDFPPLRLGGPAGRLVEATTDDALIDAVRDADVRGEPMLLLAGGSNLVIADEGFSGTVVRIATRGIAREPTPDGETLRVAAGEPGGAVVAGAVTQRAAGVEWPVRVPRPGGAAPHPEA